MAALRRSPQTYVSDMVQALEKVVAEEMFAGKEPLRVSQLAPGMVLAADIFTESGAILMNQGTELSFMTCRLLNNREQKENRDPIKGPIWVVLKSMINKAPG